MAVKLITIQNGEEQSTTGKRHFYIGLYADSRPTIASHTGLPKPTPGSQYYCYDTMTAEITYDGTNWVSYPMASAGGGGEMARFFVSSAATTTTITAAALADVAGEYVGQMVLPLQGAMAGEGRYITAYDGSAVLTVSPAWASDPDAAGNIAFAVVSGAWGLTAGSVGYVGDTATAENLSDIATTSLHAKVRRVLLGIGHATYGLNALLTAIGNAIAAPAAALAAVAYKRQTGVTQIFQKAITSAANTNGIVTIATVTTTACLIKSIVVKAVTAVQTDLTSAAIKGGASQAVTFISAVTATQANITAIDQQVTWTGAVELAATKTIVMDVQGTGTTPVNLLVTIEYEAAVDNGYLA